MKPFVFALAAALLPAQAAHAQDGLYYGAGIAVIDSTSWPSRGFGFYETSGTDVGLALTVGYRFAGEYAFGVEGNLDLTTGNRMDDSCNSIGPAWCDVESTLRLRGTYNWTLGNGSVLTGSLGGVVIKGVAEDGPSDFVDATATGVSVGVAWQGQGNLPLRYDLNFDSINSDDATNYQRELDVIGLRLSYMF